MTSASPQPSAEPACPEPAPAAAPASAAPSAASPEAAPAPGAVAGRRISGQVWAALGIVYVVWGSTYLAIRIVVETMPPFLSAGVRFLTAGLLLAGLLAWRQGPAALRVSPRQLGSAALVGLLLLIGGNGMVVLAERSVPSAWRR
ncbi:hypothetical protein GCM10025734_63770 [Kitasatospora paranensis]|uniref:EamA family transporter n=1 Tax=Kitasatospora paranensis TaxID=258053 RepID=UPI0031ED6E19